MMFDGSCRGSVGLEGALCAFLLWEREGWTGGYKSQNKIMSG